MLVFTAIYLIIYSIKGVNKKTNGYFSAILSCIIYSGCAKFIIVGYKLVVKIKESMSNPYLLIIQACWLIMCIVIIMGMLKKDFEIEWFGFKILKGKSNNKTQKINFFKIFFRILFIIAGCISAVFAMLTAYDSRENIFQAIVLIIFGIIMSSTFWFLSKFFKN